MASSAPTVGVIGLGFGRAHIPAFQANGCTVVAICQRDEASARKIADRYGVPHVFAKWEDLLERAKPDIVVIATPPNLHEAIARRAFAGGAHVLCEKPLAMDRREGESMVEAAHRARRVAMTGFNWRFTPAMLRFNEMARDGALGRVFHLAIRWLGGRWADEGTAPTWRLDRAHAGHGALGDVGVHLVDLIRWSFGDFRRVMAHVGVAYPSRMAPGGAKVADTDDYASVVAELASGAEATMLVSRVARGASDKTLEAYGTHGALAYRLDRDQPEWWRGELRAASTTGGFQPVDVPAAADVSAARGDGMEIIGRALIAPLVARMLDGIRTGQTPSPSLEDGVRAQAVLDAVLESIATGRWATVQ